MKRNNSIGSSAQFLSAMQEFTLCLNSLNKMSSENEMRRKSKIMGNYGIKVVVDLGGGCGVYDMGGVRFRVNGCRCVNGKISKLLKPSLL